MIQGLEASPTFKYRTKFRSRGKICVLVKPPVFLLQQARYGSPAPDLGPSLTEAAEDLQHALGSVQSTMNARAQLRASRSSKWKSPSHASASHSPGNSSWQQLDQGGGFSALPDTVNLAQPADPGSAAPDCSEPPSKQRCIEVSSALSAEQSAPVELASLAAQTSVELPDVENILRCADQQQKPYPVRGSSRQ